MDGIENVFAPPLFLFNGHLETIYPALFRKTQTLPFIHERIETPDCDFLDTYWLTQNAKTVVIISHGLEGNVSRPYMQGMAGACFKNGFDVLTWNFRSCGLEMNQQLRFYHSGATDDLDDVVKYVETKKYESIYLIGFSLGGNLTLKYLGEKRALPASLKKAVALSVPMDLLSSCQKLSHPSNWIYHQRFLRSLKKKMIRKSHIMKGLDVNGIERIKTLIEFDDRYTAPLHGFENAEHYYTENSSLQFLKNINVPTLIINAKNDPFLSQQCYPNLLLKDHPFVHFESPVKGGHVGFVQFSKNGLYWSEERTIDFFTRQESKL